MTIGICGSRSTIARAFIAFDVEDPYQSQLDTMRLDLPRYLICTGYLAGKALNELDAEQAERTWSLNFLAIAKFCDRVLDRNVMARICIIGSESGIEGSHDMAYAGAKAAMHRYIETKRLKHGDQMLVGLAPGIIWDSAMTQGRPDLEAVQARGEATRLGRWLAAKEVAAEARHLLYFASPTLSGQVIRMRAGEAR